MSNDTTPASDTERKCNVMEYDGAFKCYTHSVMWGAVSKPDEPVCAGAYRALQAENERLREEIELYKLDKTRIENECITRQNWLVDTRIERERFRDEAEQWQQAASEQMVRAEGLEDANEKLQAERDKYKAEAESLRDTLRRIDEDDWP